MEGIKELIAQVKLFCRLDIAFSEMLEKHEKELYALKEDNKRMVVTVRKLEKQYSELLYAFSALKKDGV